GEHRGAGPARPGAGHRIVRVAIVPPADIGAGRYVDRLGLVLTHEDFPARDVALGAVVAIGTLGDHDLDVDPVPIGIVQGQPGTAPRRRTEHRAAGEHRWRDHPNTAHLFAPPFHTGLPAQAGIHLPTDRAT